MESKNAKDDKKVEKDLKVEEKKIEKEKPIKLEGKCAVLEHSGLFAAYESSIKLEKKIKLALCF